MNTIDSDPYRLARFVDAQADSFMEALSELRAGQKRSHWIWYIFPQVSGLGFSSMAQRYAISSRVEAEAYLSHPILGPRLIACTEAILSVERRTALEIMGTPDNMKLQSSMTLFAAVSPSGSVFERVLEKYFAGAEDAKTTGFLLRDASDPA